MRVLPLLASVLALAPLAACGDDDPSGTGGSAGTTTASSSSGTGATTSSSSSSGGGDGGSDQGGAGPGGAGPGGAGPGGGGGGDQGGGGNAATWTVPACDEIAGDLPIATFTTDRGATIAARDSTLSGVRYTWGLVALDAANTLLAVSNGELHRSTDAGCTWGSLGNLPDALVRLVGARGGRAYAFSEVQPVLAHIDAEGAIFPQLVPGGGAAAQRALGVDRDDADRVRVVLETGAVWESTDAAASFTEVSGGAPEGCFYTAEIDPNDLDHIVCGTITEGAWVTFDGGASWEQATGDALYANAFRAAISPADGNVVWVQGYELGLHEGQPVGEDIRRIWRSTDGGRTFVSVVDERSEATGDGETPDLVNGNPIYADPSDPDVLYYTFGMPPGVGGPNRAELFRVDAGSGELSMEMQSGGDIDDYGALAFHPSDPSILYLGLTSERPEEP